MSINKSASWPEFPYCPAGISVLPHMHLNEPSFQVEVKDPSMALTRTDPRNRSNNYTILDPKP